MWRDVLITMRRLARRPGFTLAAVATLAVGIGATTAIFSTVNATLLRPLPFPDADDLYFLGSRLVDGRYTTGRDRVSGAHVHAINDQARTVRHAVAYGVSRTAVIPEGGAPRDVMIGHVSEGFFDLFAAPMGAGRAFVPEDHIPEVREQTVAGPGGEARTVMVTVAPSVAILSDGLWSELFARDPMIVDRTIRLRGRSVTVLGVAPPELEFPLGADLWLPFALPDAVLIAYNGFLRANPGASQEQIEAELAAIAFGLEERFPSFADRVYAILPLNELLVGDLAPILLVVLGGALVLLVLGSVNVATLLLAKGQRQATEMGVRLALGSDRARIMRRFLGESLLLASAGTIVGLLLAFVGVRILVAWGGSDLPRMDQVPLDWRVLAFCVAVLTGATVLVGLLPALRLSAPDLRGLLSESGRSASGGQGSRRIMNALVVAEISLAITLVAGAGWLVRSYLNLSSMDLGFATEGRLLVDPMLPDDQAAVQNWMAAAPERLRSLNVVSRLGASSALPLRPYYDSGWYVAVPGDDYDVNRQNVAIRTAVSPGFFEAMGTRLLAGRMLTEEDRPPPRVTRTDPTSGQPESGTIDRETGEFRPGPADFGLPRVVVNRAFAESYLAGRDPVGVLFGFGAPVVDFDNLQEIVGVVENIQYRSLRDVPTPVWYVPTALAARGWIIETTLADPTDAIPTIRAALAQVDPAIRVDIIPLSELLSDAMWRHRLGLVLMSLFAAVSLALAAIGIFGVVAHSTAQRRRELATMIALGATPGKVVAILLSQAWVLSVAGIILGLAAAYVGGRVVTNRFHQVRADDPAILIGAVMAVMTVTLVAFLLPALRAARIRPAEVLKGD